MPQKRQGDEAILVRSLGLGLPDGHRIEPHVHPWPQLVYASEGVMTVSTPAGNWVVPPQRAVWIPADFEHEIRMTGRVRMRTIYVRPDLARELPAVCCVVGVPSLLRELILETLRLGMLRETCAEESRLASVLIDRLTRTPEAPLELRWPTDSRARRVAERVRDHLDRPLVLSELAKGSGASVRTIERLFREQTGQTFGRWLQRARALRALEHLASGDSVTQAAFSVGYESTSAFIAMFQRVLGRTPGNYYGRAAE